MKKIIAGVSALGSMLMAVPVLAQEPKKIKDLVNVGLNYATIAGLGTKDVREVIFLIINVILGFLSIIAVLLVLWGGFQWMTAGGEEEKISGAKKTIIAGIVGLVIIFTAYAIAAFVVRQLADITTTE